LGEGGSEMQIKAFLLTQDRNFVGTERFSNKIKMNFLEKKLNTFDTSDKNSLI
jgi:hypothetical protein